MFVRFIYNKSKRETFINLDNVTDIAVTYNDEKYNALSFHTTSVNKNQDLLIKFDTYEHLEAAIQRIFSLQNQKSCSLIIFDESDGLIYF